MIKTKQSVTFEPSDYKYPQWLPVDSEPTVKPSVKITEAEIVHAASHGVTWEQLEAYYTVDQDSLKKYLTLWYSKSEATMHINILDSMVKSAVDDKNPTMLKWLSSNYLNMVDKVTAVPVTQTVDEDSLNAKLASLLSLYGGSSTIGDTK
jgi:hypothetical protein